MFQLPFMVQALHPQLYRYTIILPRGACRWQGIVFVDLALGEISRLVWALQLLSNSLTSIPLIFTLAGAC